MYIFIYMCDVHFMCVCSYVQGPVEAREGAGYFKAAVTNGYGLPKMGSGTTITTMSPELS